MFGTGKVVRGIQGRLHHAGSAAGLARRAAGKRTRSLQALGTKRDLGLVLPGLSSSCRMAPLSTTASAERAVVNGKVVPKTEDIVHERFLACVTKGDANAAMAHFAFISCDAREKGAAEAKAAAEAEAAAEAAKSAAEGEGESEAKSAEREAELLVLRRRQLLMLMTLRMRQLLVLLCDKGMVKEASNLLANAVASPDFDSRDPSTIASFMYVMSGCLRHGEVDRALLHFRQASERGIGLALPVCESLATALYVKGMQGEATEMQAWNVLEYIRQRGMVHRPEVCEDALLCALASADLSFALRMCQYVDDEGIVIDQDVRDALLRTVSHAIRKLPDTAAVSVGGGGGGVAFDDLRGAATSPAAQGDGAGGFEETVGGGGGEGGVDGEWKVEGTNATVEELWALDALLQSWLDAEMDEFDHDEEDDEEDDEEEGQEFELSVESSDEDEDKAAAGADEWTSDVVDYDGGDMNTTMTVEDIEHGADDVVDFRGDLDDEDDDDDDDNSGAPGGAGGGEKNSASGASPPPQRRKGRAGEQQEDEGGARGAEGDHRGSPAEQGFLDFGGGEFCGDLMDQMSELHPDQEEMPFKMHGETWEDDDDDFFPAPADGYTRRGGGGGGRDQVRGSRRRGGGHRGRPGAHGGRRSVYADIVMPYGDPRDEGGQGIVSIPVKITSVPDNDDDDDEGNDSGSGGAGGAGGRGGGASSA
ncbi:unnamed protein product [Scytosiphon promiscuus]